MAEISLLERMVRLDRLREQYRSTSLYRDGGPADDYIQALEIEARIVGVLPEED